MWSTSFRRTAIVTLKNKEKHEKYSGNIAHVGNCMHICGATTYY